MYVSGSVAVLGNAHTPMERSDSKKSLASFSKCSGLSAYKYLPTQFFLPRQSLTNGIDCNKVSVKNAWFTFAFLSHSFKCFNIPNMSARQFLAGNNND